MSGKLLRPSQRRSAPVSVKITGRTLKFRGNLDLEAASLFFEIPVEKRMAIRWVDLSDVGSVYARGFLPIASDFVVSHKTVQLRITDNASVERFLDLYGYRMLLTGTHLSASRGARQRIHYFREDSDALHGYVTRSVDEFLDRAIRCDRSGAQSLEWALGELTGNVFHHANSPIGLVVQCLVQPNNQVIFTLVDRGIGILESMAEVAGVATDRQAIEAALRRRVTSKRENQGWGLFGSAAIVEAAHGSFMLWSGRSAFFIRQDGRREFREMPDFPGTAIDWRMPTYTKLDLQSVLDIKNEPLTLLWDRYESEMGVLRFRITEEATTFTDRPTGRRLRNRLLNLNRGAPTNRCIVDFARVRMVSSSFADEFLGKYAVLLGESSYKQFVRLDNINDAVLGVVNGAIQERLRTERASKTPIRISSQ